MLQRILLWLGLACVFGSFSSSHAETLELELLPQAWIGQPKIKLADLVKEVAPSSAGTQALLQMDLGFAPRIANVERMSRAQLSSLLQRRALQSEEKQLQIVWRGAQSVAIQTKTQMISAAELAAVAVPAVRQQVETELQLSDLHLNLREALLDTEVPIGAVAIKLRQISGKPWHAQRTVWLDIDVAGNFYRTVVVAVQLSAKQAVLVARHSINVGSKLSEADFIVRQLDPFSLSGIAAKPQALQAATSWPATQALTEGQVLLQHMLPANGSVTRGALVRVWSKVAGLLIEANGVALQDAGLGQKLSVRLTQNNEIVTGQLQQDGAVLVLY